MKGTFYVSSFIILFLLFLSTSAEAATLYFEPYESEIHPGDTIALALRIDTEEEECVNAFDIVLSYGARIIPVDVSRGSSIVPIWVEDPVIDKDNRTISFAGGIPNGYCGRIAGDPRLTNIIAEILFQAPPFAIGINTDEQTAQVTLSPDTKVYLNDGAGTLAPLQLLGASFLVEKEPRSEPKDDWLTRVINDTVPPQEFSVTLETSESIYGGRHFVTFNTTDKQSGIDHYEIMEEPIDDFDLFAWGRVDAPWLKGKSPYLLKDQSLNSTIRVKAVDKAGNEYIAVYVPTEEMRGFSDRQLASGGLMVAGLLIVLVAVGSYLVYRRRLRTYEEKYGINNN